MTTERRGKFSLFGFILGVTGVGTIMSAGLLTLVIVLNKIFRMESGIPSVSSQLMVALCVLIFLMGAFVFIGSISIWKLSVKGAGVNLGIGLVLVALAQGLVLLLPDFVPTDRALSSFLTLLYYVTGIAPTLSGIFSLIAYFMQK
jgi:hypothetical protein